MALRAAESAEDWEKLFVEEFGLKSSVASNYGKLLSEEGYCSQTVQMMLNHTAPGQPCDALVQLGLKPGHCLKLAMHFSIGQSSSTTDKPRSTQVKIPRPTLTMNVNQVDFDQFCYEWETYRTHYGLQQSEIASHLFYCGSEEVRRRIRIETPSFTTGSQYSEENLLCMLKSIVLSKVSRIVHVKQFHSLYQSPGESCSEYLSRLQTKASCCDFFCTSCQASGTTERVKEQFIVGITNKVIQTAVLKTESVNPGTPLDKLLAEALTLEQSIKDQTSLQGEPKDLYAIQSNESHDDEEEVPLVARVQKSQGNFKNVPSRGCSGCGKKTHVSFEREKKCPAWGKKCFNCGGMNHFSSVCRSAKAPSQSRNASAQLLEMTCMSAETDKSTLLSVKIRPIIKSKLPFIELTTFPDTGANICLAGPDQLRLLGVTHDQMSPCSAKISVAGGGCIYADAHFLACIKLGNHSSEQKVFYSKNADRFFLSRQVCKDLCIIPKCFPSPPSSSLPVTVTDEKSVAALVGRVHKGPMKPEKIPFQPTVANIPKLKDYLIEKFADSAFNTNTPFPKLSTPPAKIHLKPHHTVPKPAYWPATVAEHWAEEVRESIERDVKAGVLMKVPFNEPTEWCARMVVVKKKDGRPRRTVDYQQLNAQCLREPNYGESPFHTARRVPANSWKSTFDAVDGYHSVELDEESSKLTTFITPWGRFRYLRFPQGHCSAGDAFNGRVQHIVSKIPRLVRIVDDICIHDESIEDAFWHAWQVLSVCTDNGIVINQSKFQFCCKEIQFAGLSITPEGVQPSKKMLAAILNFPPPTDISKARAFFGLVNQVQWCYANSSEMAPFRDLVRPNSSFTWNDELKKLFDKCKEKIIGQVRQGVQMYDTKRATCLQTDFSKNGLGYLLLQKYCDCAIDAAPLCCKSGWKLVFAGSRFTKGAEARYAPTEGEALAVSWALNHSHLFTMGCQNLIISTDHRPLLGIFNNKPLQEIKNPRLFRLKEQTLAFNFTMKYNQGKWHRAPDALSRNPQSVSDVSLCEVAGILSEPERYDHNKVSYDEHEAELAINELTSSDVVSLDDIRQEIDTDPEMKALKSMIEKGFPSTYQSCDPSVKRYFNVRNELWIQNGVLMFKDRLVIPCKLRKTILNILHGAHQGIEGMRARASCTVYWPGLSSCIKNVRINCATCNRIAPSQARQPLQLMPAPLFPFQHVAVDAFELSGHHYLAVVDKYSGWIVVFHVKYSPTHQHIINSLRSLFSVYGAPEYIYTDGGLAFQAQEFVSFLKQWKIHHVTSSAHYPQGNGRAELAVKTAKRLLQDNTASDGSLNCEKACKALLQYRNTPIKHIGLSPAQLLFHRTLRDSLPVDPRALKPSKLWIEAADKREEAFSKRNADMATRYDRHARPLRPLSVGTRVFIQDYDGKKRWSRSGVIVEMDGRKCFIKMDGSGRIVSRNRRFIKEFVSNADEEAVEDALMNSVTSPVLFSSPAPSSEQQFSESLPESVEPDVEHGEEMVEPRLRPHNRPGLREQRTEFAGRTTRSGKIY